ncbi:MAG: hypothetical protein RL701_6726, partial [Pseudomonadota bacterium]
RAYTPTLRISRVCASDMVVHSVRLRERSQRVSHSQIDARQHQQLFLDQRCGSVFDQPIAQRAQRAALDARCTRVARSARGFCRRRQARAALAWRWQRAAARIRLRARPVHARPPPHAVQRARAPKLRRAHPRLHRRSARSSLMFVPWPRITPRVRVSLTRQLFSPRDRR